MHIVRLECENFKILRAVEITTDGNIVTIGGDNGQGKSSVLDAIWVALKGRGVAPPIPIRKGEEQCRIRVDLGELVISRTFTAKEGGINVSRLSGYSLKKISDHDMDEIFAGYEGMFSGLHDRLTKQ